MKIIIADNQDITRIGLQYVCSQMGLDNLGKATDKAGLLAQLKESDDAVAIIDYTLFDINDLDELQILSQRFPRTVWVLFSLELTTDFVRRAVAVSSMFSILLKDTPLDEIQDCLRFALRRQRYICQHMTEMLLAPAQQEQEEQIKLTRTETEILRDIAMGMTTKEIAERRFSSFHTVNTHRKNIFRKLGVNNVHEAIKYALRAGLVDAAEYYI